MPCRNAQNPMTSSSILFFFLICIFKSVFFFLHIIVCVHVGLHIPWNVCRDQRSNSGSQFSPFVYINTHIINGVVF